MSLETMLLARLQRPCPRWRGASELKGIEITEEATMPWTDFEFAVGWSIEQRMREVGHRVKVVFDDPLDLKGLVSFRKVCKELQAQPLSHLRANWLGASEYPLADRVSADLDHVRRHYESAGYRLVIEPVLESVDYPRWQDGGRSATLDLFPPALHAELLDQLKQVGVPTIRQEETPAKLRHLVGDREAIIQKISDLMQELAHPPEPLGKAIGKSPEPEAFVLSSPPRFRYVEEAILPDFVEQYECAGCQEYKNVFSFSENFSIDGAKVNRTGMACVNCRKTLAITHYNDKSIKKKIYEALDAFHDGGLPRQEILGKVEHIHREYLTSQSIPLWLQDPDWPLCCGDFCVFMGNAGESYRGPYDDFTWWGYENDGALEYGLEGMIFEDGDPVMLFHCRSCEVRYWTYQTT